MAAQVMAELESACRICLMEFPGTMTDIHHKPAGANRIREIITICIPVKICENDGGPRFICPQCLTKLQIVLQFREKTLNSDKILQRLWKAVPKSNQQIPMDNNSVSNLKTNTSECLLLNACSPVKTVSDRNLAQNCPAVSILYDRLTVENISEIDSNKKTSQTSFPNSTTVPTESLLLSPYGLNKNRHSAITNTSDTLSTPEQPRSPVFKITNPIFNRITTSLTKKESADQQRINDSLSFPDSKCEQIKPLINKSIEVSLSPKKSNSPTNDLKTNKKQVTSVTELLSTNVEDNSTPVYETVNDSNLTDRQDFIDDLLANAVIKEQVKDSGRQFSQLVPETDTSVGLNKEIKRTKPQSRGKRKLSDLSSDFETSVSKKQKRKKKRSSKKRNSVSRSKRISVNDLENLSMDSFDDLVASANDVPNSKNPNENQETGNEVTEQESVMNEERLNLQKSLDETAQAIDELFGGTPQEKENVENNFGSNETPDSDKKISLRDRSKIRIRKLSEDGSDCFDDSDADETWDLHNAEDDTSNESFDSDRSENDRFKRKKVFRGSRGRPKKLSSILNAFFVNSESNIDTEVVNSEQELIASAEPTAVSSTPESKTPESKTPESKTKHKSNKSSPSYRKPGLLSSRPGPLSSKPGPLSSKPGPLSSKPGPLSSKPGPLSSKPGPLSSKPGPLSSKPGPLSSKPGPISSKSKPGPKSSKSPKSVQSEKQNSVDNKSTNRNVKVPLVVKKTIDKKTRKFIDFIVIDDDDEDDPVITESNDNESLKEKEPVPNNVTESSKDGTDQQDKENSANAQETNESASKEVRPVVYAQISECEHCENWFTMSETEFVDHVKECRTMIHSCHLCKGRFKDIAELQNHLGKKHLKELQVCTRCSKLFYSLAHYWNHRCDEEKTRTEEEVEIVDDIKKYQCGICDRNYEHIRFFILHFERTHNTPANNNVPLTLNDSD